jgi:hypothetical protein
MKQIGYYLLCGLFILLCQAVESKNPSPQKVRTIVTTDGEVDDMDSFIRMLLYTNEFKVEGLIYTSSMWHYKGDGKGTLFTSEMPMTAKMYGAITDLRWVGTTWMQEMIDKYAKVYPNLLLHDKSYPTPEYLKSIIRVGNIDFEGEMAKDTEGSDFIKKILLDNNDHPVYVQMWGGTNTLARALKSIEEQYKGKPEWQSVYKKVSAKTILYIILDQDAAYKKYVEKSWPDVKVIYNSRQFWCLAYGGVRTFPENLKPFLSGDWFSKNIINGHGPLLETYYLWGDGRQIAGDKEHNQGSEDVMKKAGMHQYDFLSEGDSPSYFHLFNFGLDQPENPLYGGPGGRFVQSGEVKSRWEDGKESADFNPYTQKPDATYSQVRWFGVLQNDFAARADWCVKKYNEANHAPEVAVDKNRITAKIGEKISLKGSATDPDGNKLTYKWWQYTEAGTYPKVVDIQNGGNSEASVVIPVDAKSGQTLHFILEVTDNGTPQLTRFQRIVIQINYKL